MVENDRARKQREPDGLLARDKELDRLFEDNVSGKIDDARFAKMSRRYEQEQGENARRIRALRLELKKAEGRQMDVDQFLESVRRYIDVTAVTRRMVTELIDHIDVYHAEQDAMGRHKRIVIHCNSIGAVEAPDCRKIKSAEITMKTRKGVAVSCTPTQIAVEKRT